MQSMDGAAALARRRRDGTHSGEQHEEGNIGCGSTIGRGARGNAPSRGPGGASPRRGQRGDADNAARARRPARAASSRNGEAHARASWRDGRPRARRRPNGRSPRPAPEPRRRLPDESTRAQSVGRNSEAVKNAAPGNRCGFFRLASLVGWHEQYRHLRSDSGGGINDAASRPDRLSCACHLRRAASMAALAPNPTVTGNETW
jgi:hypothetical protein